MGDIILTLMTFGIGIITGMFIHSQMEQPKK